MKSYMHLCVVPVWKDFEGAYSLLQDTGMQDIKLEIKCLEGALCGAWKNWEGTKKALDETSL